MELERTSSDDDPNNVTQPSVPFPIPSPSQQECDVMGLTRLFTNAPLDVKYAVQKGRHLIAARDISAGNLQTDQY